MDETQPVADDEFVYRRIHRVYYQADLPLPVQLAAFRPNPNDTKGLSVFRACLLAPAGTLAEVEAARRNEYYVARLAVAALRDLGLTVIPDPAANGPPGHALIPELNWTSYQADKRRWKQVQLELARLASADIVHRPS